LADKPQTPITPSDHEADALFKIQMKLADIVLGYWKQGLVFVGVVLVLVLVVGVGQNWIRDRRRESSASMERILEKMPAPDPLSAYGLAAPDNLADQARVAALKEGAEGLEAVAHDASGTAAAQAWIEAGQAWERAGDKDRQLKAFQEAYSASHKDILGFTAGSRIASLLVEKGDLQGAEKILREVCTAQEGYLGESALLELMAVQIQEAKPDDVKRTAAEFRARFPKSSRLDRVSMMEARATSTQGS
jgi:hypothetical protein